MFLSIFMAQFPWGEVGSFLFFLAVKKHSDQKKLRGGQGLFDLHFLGHNLSLREVRPGAQTGTKAEIMQECCLLAHSQAQARPAFL